MSKKIAEHLLEINAVSLRPQEPFTWSSGMRSPIYCDNRLTMSYPEVRREIANGLGELIQAHFPEAEVIAGTATAGIPHAAWVSAKLDMPMCYVRSSAKGHGKGNQIEGKIMPGQKVVIVEDLISTGGSVITAAEALRAAGAEVIGAVAIFTYALDKGKQLLSEAELKVAALSNFPELVEAAKEKGYISESDMDALSEWRKDPAGWSHARVN
ncbi:orotate phosphoribosyltransferase [Bacillus sp. FJAT-27225]|uniref:orotate phosphoribosyltransferase n=1 Tax=Bacillus sp. FJAT-27225 TaxID=1743144 RepID=UPI00080C284E|nr:orotate phosphoribosyltransferase [Bacillus sp. FJAT-27225]OCA85505.1 orotate phosphoribosyltransferase [Bacillus sp. FJAT-27225]